MISTSKLFSQSINYPEKMSWLKGLGLDEVSFVLKEYAASHLLRILEFSKNQIQGVLLERGSSLPEVILRHAELFPGPSQLSDLTLVERLFPYPWSSFVNPNRSLEGDWNFENRDFEEKCKELSQKVVQLEEKLKQSELGCIQMRTGETTEAFLFHFVTGKILQSGFSKEFDVNQSPLRQKVASIAWTEIQIPKSSKLRGFDLASSQMDQAIQNCRNLKLPPQTLRQTLEIPLEL